MQPPSLSALLHLDRLDRDRFRIGPSGLFTHRIYGGEVAAQALMAATGTVGSDREMHSAHVHFLRPGHPEQAMDYVVERVRDSRSLATRLVRAEQEGRTLALATVSFHVERTGPEHQIASPGAPPPERIPSRAEGLAEVATSWPPTRGAVPEVVRTPWPVDIRYVDRAPYASAEPREPSNRLWLRTVEKLPDDPGTHAAALAFATDFPMFEPSLFPHGVPWLDAVGGRAWFGSSLDHTLFFHRPLRADEWLLMTQHNPITSGSRGFAEARVFTSDGVLVATAVQESVMSPPVSVVS